MIDIRPHGLPILWIITAIVQILSTLIHYRNTGTDHHIRKSILDRSLIIGGMHESSEIMIVDETA